MFATGGQFPLAPKKKALPSKELAFLELKFLKIKPVFALNFLKNTQFLFPNQRYNPFLPGRFTSKGLRFFPRPSWMSLLKVIMLKARIHPLTAAIGRRIPEISYFPWNRVTIISFRELLLLNEQIPFSGPHG
jgi:hypothetical protein